MVSQGAPITHQEHRVRRVLATYHNDIIRQEGQDMEITYRAVY